MSGIRRVFPEAFRREAIDRVAGSGLSACAVARELGLPETVLRRWMVRLCFPQATATPRRPYMQAVAPSLSDLAAEIARLRHKNDRLRMERDILKKSSSSSERPPDESRDGR